jgi:hypothetical protein
MPENQGTEISSQEDARIKALQDEFSTTKTETKQLMLDIKALLMEAASPLRSQGQNGKSSAQNGEPRGN